MEKAITTIIITIAAIVAVTMVVNSMLPTIQRTGSAVVGSAGAVDDRLRSGVQIIHTTAQPSTTTVYAWVKNVGVSSVAPIERTDVFFGVEGSFARIPYGGPGCSAPCWEYTIENASDWDPTATVRLNIYTSSSVAAGVTYYLKVVIPNGIADTKYFTL